MSQQFRSAQLLPARVPEVGSLGLEARALSPFTFLSPGAVSVPPFAVCPCQHREWSDFVVGASPLSAEQDRAVAFASPCSLAG